MATKNDLITLAELVRDEILTTGGITLDGTFFPPDRGCTAFTGLCGPAVEKLIELAPTDLRIHELSLKLNTSNPFGAGRVIAEALVDGAYQIDPTIEQYIPGTQIVMDPMRNIL